MKDLQGKEMAEDEIDIELLPKGTKVSLDVPWPNGRVTRMSGTLISVSRGEAFVETAIGPVVGPIDSVEMEELDA
jgi:hypothetical protein